MANPLVETKLHVPSPRRNLVARQRLQGTLRRAGDARLTLVSAPAGFGKTTLVAKWLDAVAERAAVAWVSLDDRDNDPALFWAYVFASLERSVPGLGVAADALSDASDAPIEAVLTTLVNELHSLDIEVVIVLDDLHVIDRSEIIDGLTYLLDHLPDHVHLVISSRSDPPLPLARLRARGELLEIRAPIFASPSRKRPST